MAQFVKADTLSMEVRMQSSFVVLFRRFYYAFAVALVIAFVAIVAMNNI